MYRSTAKYKRKNVSAHIFTILCLALMLVFFRNSTYISRLVYEGGRFALIKIIPTIFPFMLLTDILISTSFFDVMSEKSAKTLQKLRINPYALAPCILGAVCGFPVGAKCVREYCDRGRLSKKEADCLLAASNCASPAFVISAVGEGMLGSVRSGIFIWGCSVFFSLLLSLLMMPKNANTDVNTSAFPVKAREDTFNFSSSFLGALKRSSLSMLSIAFLISFFYAVSSFSADIMHTLGMSKYAVSFLTSLLELSNGCNTAASLGDMSGCMCAFTVGFGGMSVYFQVKGEAHENSDMRVYLIIKAVCGLISALFAFFLL